MKDLNIVIKENSIYYINSSSQIFKFDENYNLSVISKSKYRKIPARTKCLNSRQWDLLNKFKSIYSNRNIVLFFRMKDNFNI